MNNPFIIGEEIYLRPLEKSDLTREYLSWINDSEVTRYMETGTFPTNMENLEEYYRTMTSSPNHVILAIVNKKPDKHIGNIALNNINWVNRVANLGIMIGEKKHWGKGCGTEAVKLMVNYAFWKLNLHKVWVGVDEENTSAYHIYKVVGFVDEGCLKNELYRDGKYYWKIIMGIVREEKQ